MDGDWRSRNGFTQMLLLAVVPRLEAITDGGGVTIKIPRNQILKPKDIVDILEKVQQANRNKDEEYRKILTNPGGCPMKATPSFSELPSKDWDTLRSSFRTWVTL